MTHKYEQVYINILTETRVFEKNRHPPEGSSVFGAVPGIDWEPIEGSPDFGDHHRPWRAKRMAAQIVWTTEAPPTPLRSDIGLLAVDAGEMVRVRLLGPAWWTWVHWDGNRSILCRGEACKVHAEPRHQKGFVAVEAANRCWRGKSPGYHLAVLVLTPEIGSCVAACARGAVLCVSRPPGKSNGPLSAYVEAENANRPLPVEFDPRPFVIRACSQRRRRVGS